MQKIGFLMMKLIHVLNISSRLLLSKNQLQTESYGVNNIRGGGGRGGGFVLCKFTFS